MKQNSENFSKKSLTQKEEKGDHENKREVVVEEQVKVLQKTQENMS